MSKTIERMEELDRENGILMNSKECQVISMQTVSIMLSYVNHDTQTMKMILKLEKWIPSHKLMTWMQHSMPLKNLLRMSKKNFKIVQMSNPREVFLLLIGPVC